MISFVESLMSSLVASVTSCLGRKRKKRSNSRDSWHGQENEWALQFISNIGGISRSAKETHKSFDTCNISVDCKDLL